MDDNGKLIFHNNNYRMTAPFGEWRDNHTRQHAGTDFGTSGAALPQYPPLDEGIVHKVVTTEENGNARGLHVDIQWKHLDLGIILQHASAVLVKEGDKVDTTTQVVLTGMTGKASNGERVSSGIHAHVELYTISTGLRMDFTTFNFKEVAEVVTERNIQIKDKDNKVRDVLFDVVVLKNVTYLKLRDLQDKADLCRVEYDAATNTITIVEKSYEKDSPQIAQKPAPRGR